MSQLVKMFAVIDGEATEVGRCHPGQARLLRKKGAAEWKDGKLRLLTPTTPKVDPVVHITLPADADPAEVLRVIREAEVKSQFSARPDDSMELFDRLRSINPDPSAWGKPADDGPRIVRRATTDVVDVDEHTRAILQDAGIDPSTWLPDPETTFRFQFKDVAVAGLPALLRSFLDRVGIGHQTCAYDDPKARTLGFLDLAAEEFVYTSLTAIKETRLARRDVEPFGLSIEEMKDKLFTPKGRVEIFGDGGYGLPDDEPLDEDTDGPTPAAEIDWGPLPPDVSGLFNPKVAAGYCKIVDPVLLPPPLEGETLRARIERVRVERESALGFEPKRVPGWTHFRSPEAHAAIPVYVGYGDDRKQHPPADGRHAYGMFRRSGRRLFRVWIQGHDETTTGWDESVLDEEDCTYQLKTAHRPAEPVSLEDTLAAVESRIRDLAEDAKAAHFCPGWTRFTNPAEAPVSYCMEFPPGFEVPPGLAAPLSDEEAEALRAKMVRVPFPKPGDPDFVGSYGLSRVVGDRLFRVWNEKGRCWADESVLQADGTYEVRRTTTAVDVIYASDPSKIALLSPSGLPEQVREVERRIAALEAGVEEEAWETWRPPSPHTYIYRGS